MTIGVGNLIGEEDASDFDKKQHTTTVICRTKTAKLH
jgi:hypothetical protein